MTKTIQHIHEVAEGECFTFAANWLRFLGMLHDERIVQTEQVLF
jgi:hypothetical protein